MGGFLILLERVIVKDRFKVLTVQAFSPCAREAALRGHFRQRFRKFVEVIVP